VAVKSFVDKEKMAAVMAVFLFFDGALGELVS
jgi:hypothetical protein